jgi:Protein of unknown function (DUF3306)
MSDAGRDGFLGRWSRRKQDAREGKPLDEPAPAGPSAAEVPALTGAVGRSLPEPPPGDPAQTPEAAAPLPTLKDTEVLTPASDFKPFMAQGVTSEVKNAAMKKLFADPHFNVMDRLDIYIDDYNQTTPIPPALLRQMVSAQFLGLFDEEEAREKAAKEKAERAAAGEANPPLTREGEHAAPSPDVAQSGLCNEMPEPEAAADPTARPEQAPESHANLDLRLQPDDAAPAQSPRGGAG